MEGLYLLSGFPAVRCSVCPVVIASILDHYVRRNEDQTRVIGTLLGANNDGVVEIRNSFAIPASDIDDKNKDFHRRMLDLHLRTNPQESVVGWYATGVSIDEESIRIHDFYWREMLAAPVHLLVDTGLNNDKFSINAYVGTPLSAIVEENVIGFQFRPVHLDFEATQKPEKIALDVMLKTKSAEDGLLQELDTIELSLKRLMHLLQVLSGYVGRVLNGEEEVDNRIGRLLADTVSSVPRVESATFQKMFGRSMQDLLMVVYLANLTNTQLKISDTTTKHI